MEGLEGHVEGPLVQDREVAEHASREVEWFADDGDALRVDVREEGLPYRCGLPDGDDLVEGVGGWSVDVDDEALDVVEKIVGTEER